MECEGDVNGWTWKKLVTTFDVHGNFVYKALYGFFVDY